MNPHSFKSLSPVCPLCLRDRGRNSPLVVGTSEQTGNNGDLVRGILVCTDPECRCEFPVLDSIPVLVPDIRSYVEQNALMLLQRDDLEASTLASLLGDCLGPSSAYTLERRHLSTYAFGHYGDFLGNMQAGDPAAGAVVRLLEQGLDMLGALPDGPVADLGCAVGRVSFELAARLQRPVLGADLNFGMLRAAVTLRQKKTLTFPFCRVGMAYDPAHVSAGFADSEHVDFWALDAVAPPFPDESFALAASLNLIDCVQNPVDHLRAVTRLLKPGGRALLATPYDWSPNATHPTAWLGGHSQRGENRGDSAAVLRSLLGPESPLEELKPLCITAEAEAVPWTVRLHDRSSVTYRVHLLALEKALE